MIAEPRAIVVGKQMVFPSVAGITDEQAANNNGERIPLVYKVKSCRKKVHHTSSLRQAAH